MGNKAGGSWALGGAIEAIGLDRREGVGVARPTRCNVGCIYYSLYSVRRIHSDGPRIGICIFLWMLQCAQTAGARIQRQHLATFVQEGVRQRGKHSLTHSLFN